MRARHRLLRAVLNLPLLPSPAALTVSQFARAVEGALHDVFPFPVRVTGEVSGVHFAAASGHMYFDLKDQFALVHCVCYATSQAAAYIADVCADGAALEVLADVRAYGKRSQYQLSVLEAVPVGQGRLFRLFEQLKAKLLAEGLFDEARKRSIPAFIREIAIVTSRDGMALRDFVTTARSRGAHVSVTLVHAPVQGEAAAPALAAAIRRAGRLNVDAVVVTRGGGSLEDLWAFNTELVARAIVACARPVISAVGHEADVTIADFVADRRVATPTAAAVLVAGERVKMLERLNDLAQRLARSTRLALMSASQRVDELSSGLRRNDPRRRLADLRVRTREAQTRLRQTFVRSQEERRGRLSAATAGLRALGPYQTLARGYAIVFDEAGRVVTSARQTALGEPLDILLKAGKLAAEVTGKEERDGRLDVEEEG